MTKEFYGLPIGILRTNLDVGHDLGLDLDLALGRDPDLDLSLTLGPGLEPTLKR